MHSDIIVTSPDSRIRYSVAQRGPLSQARWFKRGSRRGQISVTGGVNDRRPPVGTCNRPAVDTNTDRPTPRRSQVIMNAAVQRTWVFELHLRCFFINSPFDSVVNATREQ